MAIADNTQPTMVFVSIPRAIIELAKKYPAVDWNTVVGYAVHNDDGNLSLPLESHSRRPTLTRAEAENLIKEHLSSAQWEGDTLMVTFEQEALICALLGTAIDAPDGTDRDELIFLQDVLKEVVRSRGLFPPPDANAHALQEEAGEVSKALMYEPWSAVRKECIQLANMALRLALEGDCTMARFRRLKGNDDMPMQGEWE